MSGRSRTRRRLDQSVSASGSAPLEQVLCEFYEAVGMPLIEGYGHRRRRVDLNPLDRPRPGSIGKALPGLDVRFARRELW